MMSQRLLVSPAKDDIAPSRSSEQKPSAAHSHTGVVQCIVETLASAVEEAEATVQHVVEPSFSSTPSGPSSSSLDRIMSAVNTYRAACLAALTRLQPLILLESRTGSAIATNTASTARGSEAAASHGIATNEIARLERQLHQQEAEADEVQALLRSRIDVLERTVQTLQSERAVNFASLERHVQMQDSLDNRSPMIARGTPEHTVAPASGIDLHALSRWCIEALAASEAHARTALLEHEVSARELVAHRQLLGRAMTRAHRARIAVASSFSSSSSRAAAADVVGHDLLSAGNTAQTPPRTPLAVSLLAAAPSHSPVLDANASAQQQTHRQQVMEADVKRMAEHAATLQQSLDRQYSQLQGAVEATRQSMETVHCRALEQLAARHTEERCVLEERLADFVASLSSLREQFDRETAHHRQEKKRHQEAQDAAQARIDALAHQLTSAKKKVWCVELEKDKLQARVSVLLRQLEDTIPKTGSTLSQTQTATRRHRHAEDVDALTDVGAHYRNGTDDTSAEPQHGVFRENPGRLFQDYPELIASDTPHGGMPGVRASRVDPSVWERQEHQQAVRAPSSPRSSRIKVTAVSGAPPVSSAGRAMPVAAEDGLVVTPRARSAPAVACSASRRAVGDANGATSDEHTHVGSLQEEGETSMPSPRAPLWTSASSFAASPEPKGPPQPQPRAASPHTQPPKLLSDTLERLDGIQCALSEKLCAVRDAMQRHVTAHEVHRRQHQKEARHLQTTRHYYEHALGLTRGDAENGAEGVSLRHSLTSGSAAATAQEQLDVICRQLDALEAASDAEESHFAAKMRAARGQHDELMTLLRQVEEKKTALGC